MEKIINPNTGLLAAYFLIVLVLGWLARRGSKDGAEGFYLAGRSLSPWVLIGTMIATNLSAFTVFGASGAGYRDGLVFLPVMAFGTGFMALNFRLIGRRVWELGRQHGLVTPSELVGKVYGSRPLAVLFAVVLIVFTVPYLALQPLAAGQVLGRLLDMPEWIGAVLATLAILAYTLRGGLRAVAWTDLLQGLILFAVLITAVVVVSGHYGGWNAAFERLMESEPELFSRPGPRGRYTPGVWLGFMLLWFCCDPMFPQLFQRMYAARDRRTLDLTMLLYPAVITVILGVTVSLGMLGRLEFPGLGATESDGILPMFMSRVGGELMGTLVIAAGLAALMSTMDSQLLTLSSIFSRDIVPVKLGGILTERVLPRLFVILLALAGLTLALFSDTTILDLGLLAFTGLAALFPTMLFGLWLKKPSPAAGLASILAGESLAVAFHQGLLKTQITIPAVWVILASTLVFVAVQTFAGGIKLPRIEKRALVFALGCALIFVLAMDFSNWNQAGPLWLGWPGWIWRTVGLSVAQTLLVLWYLRITAGQDSRLNE